MFSDGPNQYDDLDWADAILDDSEGKKILDEYQKGETDLWMVDGKVTCVLKPGVEKKKKFKKDVEDAKDIDDIKKILLGT